MLKVTEERIRNIIDNSIRNMGNVITKDFSIMLFNEFNRAGIIENINEKIDTHPLITRKRMLNVGKEICALKTKIDLILKHIGAEIKTVEAQPEKIVCVKTDRSK